MTKLEYDIVLLPTKELGDKAVATSQALEKFGSLYTLKYDIFYPHVSLYMFWLDQDNLGTLVDVLGIIAAQTKVRSLIPTNFMLQNKYNYVDVEYEADSALIQLQHMVLEAVNPLRTIDNPDSARKLQESNHILLENYKKYGYKTVGEQFRPHMTFTRFRSEQNFEALQMPDLRTFAGDFTHIGLYEIDENGTCIKEIASFPLNTETAKL